MNERISDPEVAQVPFEAERAFHADKWKLAAAEYNKTWFGKILKRDAEYFMRAEAYLDNADFDKRQHAEFMHWQEQLKVVAASFLEKANNPESKKRTLIFIMGGAMNTPLSAGQLVGLNMMGVMPGRGIDVVAGSSGGACAGSYFLAGPEQTLAGVSMMTDDFATTEFIDRSKPFRKVGTVNLAMMKDLMSKGRTALNQAAVRNSPAKLWYAVTHPVKSGEEPQVEFLNAKTIPDMLDGVVSSMSIPGATGKIPEIEGITYYDGGFASLPLEQLIKKFTKEQGGPPTDILILPTMPFELLENIKASSAEMNVANLARLQEGSLQVARRSKYRASLGQLKAGLLLKEAFRGSLLKLKEQAGINIAVMWPPAAQISALGINSNAMKTAVIGAARDTIKQFGGVQPTEIPLHARQSRSRADMGHS